jgi:hypothetical protein
MGSRPKKNFNSYIKDLLEAREAKRKAYTPRNIDKLKAKGKRLYAILYLPTGEYLLWHEAWPATGYTVIVPRQLTEDKVAEICNSNSIWDFNSKNSIILPAIPQHFEKVELIYR